MRKKIFLVVVLAFFAVASIFSQGSNCNNSIPFCTGTTYTFPSVTGVPNMGSVSCLGSTPNPTWYHLQISNGGNLTIKIQQGSNDVDFICWGPFSNPTSACGGNGAFPSGNVASCSYSSSSIEYCNLNNTSSGQWYILLITNYSGSPGNVVFTNTGGNATTNCCILQSTEAGNPFTKNCLSNVNGHNIGTASTSGSTYSWTPAVGLSNPSISTPFANPSSTTVYTLTETDAQGCTFSDQVTVTVDNAIPNASAGSDFTTNCTAPTHTLNGSGTGPSYSWSPPTGLSNSSIATPVANPSSNTTYTLTVTGSNGCTNTDDVTINVDKAVPTVSAGADFTTNCITPTYNLNGGGSGTYSWSPSSGLSNSSIANPVANPSSTTTYTLTVTGTNGCTNTEDVLVTVDKGLPAVNAGADFTTTCTTPTYTINGSGTGTYSWSPSAGLSDTAIATPVASPSSTTTYTLTTTGANGCTNSDDVIITVDQNYPLVQTIDDITLDCNTSTGIFAATGGATYSWSTPSGGSSLQNINVDYTSLAGDYVVTVTAANGCEVVDSSILYVDTIVPVSDAGLDSVLTCTALIIDLNGINSSQGNEFTYSWDTSDGNITQGTTTTTPTVDHEGTYSLTVLNTTNHCLALDTVVIGIDTIHPIADAGMDSIVTCNVPEINLSGSGSSIGNYSYNWTTVDGMIIGDSTVINPLTNAGGIYVLTVTDNYNGCSATDNVFIDEDITANVEILSASNMIDSILGIAPQEVDFSWIGDEGTVVWNFGDNNTGTDSSIIHTYNLRGNYTAIITLTDTQGCIAYDTVYVDIDGREIIFPNIFTPNGDGQNDLFTFRGERIKTFECSIFNRWGELVYSWDAPVGGWDGRSFAGKEMPSGEYFYILKAVDRNDKSIEKTGTIMLMK